MIRLYHFFCLLFLSLFFCSCDPAQDTDFIIVNSTSGDIEVRAFQSFGSEQLSTISSGNKLIIQEFVELDCGSTKSGHFDDLLHDSIFVFNSAGQACTINFLDIDSWSYFPNQSVKNDCSAVLEVEINDGDF